VPSTATIRHTYWYYMMTCLWHVCHVSVVVVVYLRDASNIYSGYAFVQNLRPGHYELAHDNEPGRRLEAIFAELARANGRSTRPGKDRNASDQ